MILKIKKDKERYRNSTIECERDTQWKNSQDLNKYGQSLTQDDDATVLTGVFYCLKSKNKVRLGSYILENIKISEIYRTRHCK